MSTKGYGTRYDRFTPNQANDERFKPRTKEYFAGYSSKMCQTCKKRKPTKGSTYVEIGDGKRRFVCGDCK